MKNLQKALSGSFRHCLKDFLDRFPSHAELAEFTDTPESTIRRWTGGRLPTGTRKIRALVFLHEIGYKVEEFDLLPDNIRKLGMCVAYKVCTELSIDEKMGAAPSTFSQVFIGNRGLGKEKVAIADSLIREYEEILIGLRELHSTKWKSFVTALADDKKQSAEQAPTTDHLPEQARQDEFGPVSEKTIMETADVILFAEACKRVREIGKRLIEGPREKRRLLRRLMNPSGSAPELHDTFEILNQLLKERKAD